jgi:hypothetical protein
MLKSSWNQWMKSESIIYWFCKWELLGSNVYLIGESNVVSRWNQWMKSESIIYWFCKWELLGSNVYLIGESNVEI